MTGEEPYIIMKGEKPYPNMQGMTQDLIAQMDIPRTPASRKKPVSKKNATTGTIQDSDNIQKISDDIIHGRSHLYL